ncbi:MAG: HPP family protein, partial [Verrucomicrobiales bacterium]
FSAASGCTAMLLCFCVSSFFVTPAECPVLIASMGASAVLIFALPHGPLSQPWPLIGGHMVSALVGVASQKVFGSSWLSAGLAVGLAIFAMHLFRCVHPPGGATALVAVVGGPAIQALGYSYLYKPVLVNVFVLLGAGVALNSFLPWRRYPAMFSRLKPAYDRAQSPSHSGITKDDLEYALRNFQSLIDVSEKDLEDIYHLAEDHAESRRTSLKMRPLVPNLRKIPSTEPARELVMQ